MFLSVKCVSGKCYTVELDNQTTVLEFKQRLAEKMERDVDDLILMDHGKQLKNRDVMNKALVEGIGGTGAIYVVVNVKLSNSPPKNLTAVHDRLLRITNWYLSKPEIDDAKKAAFQSLKYKLTNEARPQRDRIGAFLFALITLNKNTSTHRTPAWKRYFYNVISILTIVPAIVRAVDSNNNYGTLRFWQPESKRAIKAAKREIEHITTLSL